MHLGHYVPCCGTAVGAQTSARNRDKGQRQSTGHTALGDSCSQHRSEVQIHNPKDREGSMSKVSGASTEYQCGAGYTSVRMF